MNANERESRVIGVHWRSFAVWNTRRRSLGDQRDLRDLKDARGERPRRDVDGGNRLGELIAMCNPRQAPQERVLELPREPDEDVESAAL